MNNWYVSMWEIKRLSTKELRKIASSDNYKQSTRRTALNELNARQLNKDY